MMMRRRWIWGALLGMLAGSAWIRQAGRRRATRQNLKYRPVVQNFTLPASAAAATFDTGSIFFVGNATVIIRYAGFSILTDPNFLHQGDHVHLGYGLTARRLTNPAVDLEQLPPLDLVLLSHLHEDHFDRKVQKQLNRTLPIITTRLAAASLRRMGFHAPCGLTPWESLTVCKGEAQLTITALPGRHGPGVLAGVLPPVNGHMLEFSRSGGAPAFRLLITGDTLVYDEIKEIPRQYPDIDLALIHLGGTRVLGIYVTMDARQGVEMIRLLSPRTAIPIHYNDYSRFKSPLSDFAQAIREAGLEYKVHYLRHGETYLFSPSARRLSGNAPPQA